MGYKCINCGHIFEYGEEIDWIEPSGEAMSGCPVCKSPYVPTIPCSSCGRECVESELLAGGICMECLIDSITPERTAKYVLERDLEKEFYIGYYYNSAFNDISNELLSIAKRGFKSDSGFEKSGRNTHCTDKCILFVCGKTEKDDEDDLSAIFDYSSWLLEQENDHVQSV